MNKPHQRIGVVSNAHVGNEFEDCVSKYFTTHHQLAFNPGDRKIRIGINGTKLHAFDLVDQKGKTIIECKSHRWTAGNNIPSAKITVWNEAMYFFLMVPDEYRKIFCVLKDYSKKRKESLAEYYMRNYGHLVPTDVEIWEYDKKLQSAAQTRHPKYDLNVGTR